MKKYYYRSVAYKNGFGWRVSDIHPLEFVDLNTEAILSWQEITEKHAKSLMEKYGYEKVSATFPIKETL